MTLPQRTQSSSDDQAPQPESTVEVQAKFRLIARVQAAVEDYSLGRMTKTEFIAYLRRVS